MRYRDEKKVFNTTKNTVITVSNESSLNKINITDANVESSIKTITVPKIELIEEFNCFKACLNCNKQIMQSNSEYLLKCDFCNYVMRQESCKMSVIVKLVVNDFSEAKEKSDVHLTLFHNNIVKLMNTEEIYDEDFVCSYLLMLQNLKITYNTKRFFVVEIKVL